MGKAKTPEEKAAAAAKRAEKAAAKKAEEKAAEEQAANESKDKEQKGTVNPVPPVENSGTNQETSNPEGDNANSNGQAGPNLEGASASSAEQGDTAEKKKLAVVIPYLKVAAQGKELLYAIRSLAKNFREDFVVVVVGDKEDWFSDDILFVEHACVSQNPQADVVDKLKQILIDERISETFVWSNDDIYMVAPTTLDEIRRVKTAGTLMFNPADKGIYNANCGKTIEALESNGYPTRHFDTHLPYCFEKEKMAEVFEVFPQFGDGLLMASTYFNMHVSESEPADDINGVDGPWLLRIISQLETEEKKKKFRELIPDKHFLNNSVSGYSGLLMDWIARQFPEKCRFEK